MVTTGHAAASAHGADIGTATLPVQFWELANRRGDAVAMRSKHLGIWNDISWRTYADQARAVGCALLASGGRRGDRAALLSDGCPQWCQVEFGALGVGVLSVGLFATDSATQVARAVNDSAARWLFVQDQEQLEKALSALDAMPGIEKIVYFDGTGLHALTHAQVTGFDTFLELGRQFHGLHPARWDAELRLARPDDAATITFTSGTTGPAKGVLLSHANLAFQVQAMEQACPGLAGDEQLSFLSMAHIVERCFSVYRALAHGAVVHIGKGLPTLIENLREVSPHVLLAVPRVWEKLYASVTLAIAQGTATERLAYRAALALGYRVVDCHMAGQPVPGALALQYRLARWLVLNRVLTMTGLRRARVLVSVAARISPELVRWFQALGLPMVQTYGLTECAGMATIGRAGDVQPGSMGRALPGTEVKLADDGEILLRGPHVFVRYLDASAGDAGTLHDGWLHTADLGRLASDGRLSVTDRRQDTIMTTGGEPVSASETEARLKVSPYIADAIVVGHGRPHLACLLMIDHDAVAAYASEHKLVFTSFASLTRSPEVVQLVQRAVDHVNHDLAGGLRVQRFALIDTEITLHDAGMTPTLQLRRWVVLQKYAALVESLYADMKP